jgi:beta-aspartyl-peptidase (threonine type)
MTAERAADFHSALREALRTGAAVLAGGGSALDAVEATVVWLEDCPLFNAGRGSSFTRDGRNEMEASIMDGVSRAAGAALLLRHVRNPVRLARAVMEHTPHVSLAGEAAEAFAAERGLKLEPESYFHTQFRHDAMMRLRGTDRTALSEDTIPGAKPGDGDACGTVGAVALDRKGRLAAATSSGGTTNKYSGRIGQASQVCAGVYADDATCAVSCTGFGEAFMRTAAAFDVSARMAYLGWDVERAANAVIRERVPTVGGRGGMIALDRMGNFAAPFNTEGMYRGWIDGEGRVHTGIYDGTEEGPATRP